VVFRRAAVVAAAVVEDSYPVGDQQGDQQGDPVGNRPCSGAVGFRDEAA